MRKPLQHIQLNSQNSIQNSEVKAFDTAEGIAIKSRYSKKDIASLKHVNFAAGIPPYLRGP